MADQTSTRQRTRPVNGGVRHEAPPATITVTRAAYGGATTETQELIDVPNFVGQVARVRIEGGVTKNMQDYNSARVSVAVDLPCYPEASEIERVGIMAAQMVKDYIDRELRAIQGKF